MSGNLFQLLLTGQVRKTEQPKILNSVQLEFRTNKRVVPYQIWQAYQLTAKSRLTREKISLHHVVLVHVKRHQTHLRLGKAFALLTVSQVHNPSKLITDINEFWWSSERVICRLKQT
jgi:hypothetical protein